jgi:hypothetical protein
VKFVATKKGMTKKDFSPLSFVAVFGSGMRDPGWVKIRIRKKHPEFATLHFEKPDPDLGGTSLFLTILLVAERTVKTKRCKFS